MTVCVCVWWRLCLLYGCTWMYLFTFDASILLLLSPKKLFCVVCIFFFCFSLFVSIITLSISETHRNTRTLISSVKLWNRFDPLNLLLYQNIIVVVSRPITLDTVCCGANFEQFILDLVLCWNFGITSTPSSATIFASICWIWITKLVIAVSLF